MTDLELLRQYAADGSDDAFRLVVQRHLGLVRGTALRQLGNDHHADEVSHAVFMALARKAGTLREGTVVAGWLFRATRFAAAKLARDEERRSRREREAAMMHIEHNSGSDDGQVWGRIAPHLNEALGALNQQDRDAVLLRFFEQRSFAEVAAGIGASEAAAKMRISRALEKLRSLLGKRGCVLGAAVLLGALSSSAATMVPMALTESVVTGAIQSQSAAGTVATLVEAILRNLRMARLKIAVTVAGTLLLAGLIVGIVGYRSGWFRPKPAPVWPPPAQPWRPQ